MKIAAEAHVMAKTRDLNRREFARRAAIAGLGVGLLRAGRADRSQPKERNGERFDGPDSLRSHADRVGLRFGCAVVPELLELAEEPIAGTDQVYTEAIKSQANILVAENAMKWSSLRPSPEDYSFGPADRLMAFAIQNNQLVRGHNLCWHEQLPGWFAAVATRENAKSLLTSHIQKVAGRYAGRMQSWDVVNEAIHVRDGRADGLRKSPWLELIGPDYLEIAYQTAATADPQAKLTYNDYDIELDTPEQEAKRGQVLLLVRRLHARGVPIHAVGIQSHLQATGAAPGQGIVSFVRELGQMGLDVYITEMDVNTRALPGGPGVQDQAVAHVYSGYLNQMLREPNVRTVLTWGITDAHTWLNQSKQPWAQRADGARQRPLLFDDQYQPAPAFFAVRHALDACLQPLSPPFTPGLPPKLGDSYAPFAVPGSPSSPLPTTPEPKLTPEPKV